jgi:hypothetical protein
MLETDGVILLARNICVYGGEEEEEEETVGVWLAGEEEG